MTPREMTILLLGWAVGFFGALIGWNWKDLRKLPRSRRAGQ
jgi:hypothetical protein